MTSTQKDQYANECSRQEENANYTATSLHIWLRELRFWKRAFLLLQLVLAGLAAYFAMSGQAVGAGIAGALAGISPSVFEALKFNESVAKASRSASEYSNIRDRFRQIRTIYSKKSTAEMGNAFDEAMNRMEAIRALSLTPPERIFKAAQKKIEAGDYQYAIDEPK